MKYLFVTITFTFISFYSSAQSSSNKNNPALSKIILGKWQSEEDKNVKLIFGAKTLIELYKRDTTDNLKYVLSYDCNGKNQIPTNINTLSKNISIFIILYNNGVIEQCNELLSLNKKTLSWMNSNNGKIFVFKRHK